MSLEQRFGAGMAAAPTSDPGLIQEADGSVWVVDTDGTRTRLPDGGGGGGGSTWYNGSGAPAGGLGANGDYYLNDDNGDVYAKAVGVWGVVANIEGPTGATGATGATGSPGSPGSPGSVWREGSGVPSNGLGIDGDFYLDGDTGDVYLKATGTYSIVANIKGPTGATGATGATGSAGTPGSVWREGSGAPSNALGIDGDYYLDGDNGDVYLKASGAYSVVANIKGPTGATGPMGSLGFVMVGQG